MDHFPGGAPTSQGEAAAGAPVWDAVRTRVDQLLTESAQWTGKQPRGRFLPRPPRPGSAQSSLAQQHLGIRSSGAARRDISRRSNRNHDQHQDHHVGQSVFW
jgi:hypothetical protein